ncbi:DUF1648 domain-containing protein [Nonomuraea antimicrobica]
MRPRVLAAAWGLAVTAVLVLAPYALRDRLPDPIATHWGSSGSVPDGSSSLTAHVVTTVVIWGVLWAALFAVSAWGHSRRANRAIWWGCLFGAGAMLVSVDASTLAVNLDAPDWRAALLPGWHVPAALGAMVAVGTLAGYLGRGPRDRHSPEAQAPPRSGWSRGGARSGSAA